MAAAVSSQVDSNASIFNVNSFYLADICGKLFVFARLRRAETPYAVKIGLAGMISMGAYTNFFVISIASSLGKS